MRTTKNTSTRKNSSPEKDAVRMSAMKKNDRSTVDKAESDIIKLILTDHKPLKKLIGTLKDLDCSLSERKAAYHDFSVMLECHSRCEEKALYSILAKEESFKLRADSAEGEVEHAIADKLIEEIDRLSGSVQWSAKVKVLAEVVEHHLNEEEQDLLPLFKRNSTPEERQKIGAKYLNLRSRLQRNLEDEYSSEDVFGNESPARM